MKDWEINQVNELYKRNDALQHENNSAMMPCRMRIINLKRLAVVVPVSWMSEWIALLIDWTRWLERYRMCWSS